MPASCAFSPACYICQLRGSHHPLLPGVHRYHSRRKFARKREEHRIDTTYVSRVVSRARSLALVVQDCRDFPWRHATPDLKIYPHSTNSKFRHETIARIPPAAHISVDVEQKLYPPLDMRTFRVPAWESLLDSHSSASPRLHVKGGLASLGWTESSACCMIVAFGALTTRRSRYWYGSIASRRRKACLALPYEQTYK